MVRDGAVGAGNGRRVPSSVRAAAREATAQATAEATEPPGEAEEPA